MVLIRSSLRISIGTYEKITQLSASSKYNYNLLIIMKVESHIHIQTCLFL